MYFNRIFLKMEEKFFYWKLNLYRWGIKLFFFVVMVNLRVLKYSMLFVKGIDFIVFCFLGCLYCYIWCVWVLYLIYLSLVDELI